MAPVGNPRSLGQNKIYDDTRRFSSNCLRLLHCLSWRADEPSVCIASIVEGRERSKLEVMQVDAIGRGSAEWGSL